MEGDSCCDTSLCQPSPFDNRCTNGPGEPCESSIECAGWMLCEEGACACQETGEDCVIDSECCEGGSCIEGSCQMEIMCVDAGEACTADEGCCGALRCREVFGSGMDEQCCSGAAGSCKDSGDCCGGTLCEGGVCQCNSDIAAPCLDDTECCGGLICVLGACAEPSGCNRVGDSCDPTMAGDCCGLAQCKRPTMGAPEQCCGAADRRCDSNADCCGAMSCNDMNRCECVPSGEICVNTSDCCGSSVCTDGRCS